VEFLTNLGLPDQAIRDLICAEWSPAFELSPATDIPHDLLENLLTERFANRSWIERF
jgi:hypothetical protein